jgi:hypothetical protein
MRKDLCLLLLSVALACAFFSTRPWSRAAALESLLRRTLLSLEWSPTEFSVQCSEIRRAPHGAPDLLVRIWVARPGVSDNLREIISFLGARLDIQDTMLLEVTGRSRLPLRTVYSRRLHRQDTLIKEAFPGCRRAERALQARTGTDPALVQWWGERSTPCVSFLVVPSRSASETEMAAIWQAYAQMGQTLGGHPGSRLIWARP